MSDIRITVVSPRGDAYIMEMPDDVPLRELLPEIAQALHIELPEAPPPRYELWSLGAGARVEGDETLSALSAKGDVTIRLDVAHEVPVRVISSPPPAPPPEVERPRQTRLWVPIDRGDGLERELPIYLFPEAYRAIRDHTSADLLHEHGGFLLGRYGADEAGHFVTIERALPAPDSRAEPTSFEFSHDAWIALVDEKERTGLVDVGWYHSHPRMAVFLSHWDLFIHKGYFRDPWKVALVVEPEKDHGGFFRWRKGELSGHEYGGCHEVLHGAPTISWTNVRPADAE